MICPWFPWWVHLHKLGPMLPQKAMIICGTAPYLGWLGIGKLTILGTLLGSSDRLNYHELSGIFGSFTTWTHTHRQILCTHIYTYIIIYTYLYNYIYIYYNLLTINGYFNIYTCNAYAYIPHNCPINCKPNHVLFSRTSLQKLAERHWRTSIIWNLISRYFDYYFLHIMPSICIYI